MFFLKNLMNLFTSKLSLGMDYMLMSKAKELWPLKLSQVYTKYISNVLFVLGINQRLLSVGQMMEKNYSLHFKDMRCTIFYPSETKLMIVEMRGKSFPVEWKLVLFYDHGALVKELKEERKVKFYIEKNTFLIFKK